MIDNINSQPVVKEVVLNMPISKVWKAITEKDEMNQWYFDLDEFNPEVGFEFQFKGGTEENTYLHKCKITEVIKEKKLTYSWRYEGYPGNSFVTFELFEESDKTRLSLTHDKLESFGTENPDLAKKNFVVGWDHIIGVSLKEYMEKK